MPTLKNFFFSVFLALDRENFRPDENVRAADFIPYYTDHYHKSVYFGGGVPMCVSIYLSIYRSIGKTDVIIIFFFVPSFVAILSFMQSLFAYFVLWSTGWIRNDVGSGLSSYGVGFSYSTGIVFQSLSPPLIREMPHRISPYCVESFPL